MEKMIAYPILEGKIAEKGIAKKRVAETLGMTPHALRNKISGKTEFIKRFQGKLATFVVGGIILSQNG